MPEQLESLIRLNLEKLEEQLESFPGTPPMMPCMSYTDFSTRYPKNLEKGLNEGVNHAVIDLSRTQILKYPIDSRNGYGSSLHRELRAFSVLGQSHGIVAVDTSGGPSFLTRSGSHIAAIEPKVSLTATSTETYQDLVRDLQLDSPAQVIFQKMFITAHEKLLQRAHSVGLAIVEIAPNADKIYASLENFGSNQDDFLLKPFDLSSSQLFLSDPQVSHLKKILDNGQEIESKLNDPLMWKSIIMKVGETLEEYLGLRLLSNSLVPKNHVDSDVNDIMKVDLLSLPTPSTRCGATKNALSNWLNLQVRKRNHLFTKDYEDLETIARIR